MLRKSRFCPKITYPVFQSKNYQGLRRRRDKGWEISLNQDNFSKKNSLRSDKLWPYVIKICTNNIIKCTRRLSLLVLRVNEGNNHPGLYYVYFNDLLIMSKSYWLSSIIKLKDMSLWHYKHFELKQWKFFMHALKSSGHYRFGSITCTLSLNWLIEGLYLST